jgi:hypothetical protein
LSGGAAVLLLSLPLLFAGFWIAVIWTIGWVGGWRELAVRYRARETFRGPLRFVSARMRWKTRYNGVLRAGADSTGLYIRPMGPFGVGHPPLYLPWSEAAAQRVPEFRGVAIELRFRGAPHVPLTLDERTMSELAAGAGPAFPEVSTA